MCVEQDQRRHGLILPLQARAGVRVEIGDAAHINNFELGQHGRHRTNVWDYAGINTMRAGRLEELAMHPTVKPTALVADAIKDCSRRGGLVLDPFCGSGTILIAAERTGRKARALEIDPTYVDVAVRRWQTYTGKSAVLAGSGETFETTEGRRIAKSRPLDHGRSDMTKDNNDRRSDSAPAAGI